MFHINNIVGSFIPSFGRLVPIKSPLVVLGGVSGVGKTSVSWVLWQRRANIHLLKTTTTRLPRKMEKEDIHYRFITMEMFAKQQMAGEFLCSTIWAGNGQAYGLAKSDFADAEDTSWQLYASTYFGAVLKAQAPQNVLHIWLMCSDDIELKHRLHCRHSSSQAQLNQRWGTAVSEQAYVQQHQNQLVAQNQIDVVIDTADRSIDEVAQEIEGCIGCFLQRKIFPLSGLATGWKSR